MENNILDDNGDIKLNVSGYLKVYHNGELVEEHKNTITNAFKSLIAERSVGKTSSTFMGSGGYVGTSPTLAPDAAQINQNRLGGGASTPDVTGKGGIFISKEQASVAAVNNVIYPLVTTFEQVDTFNTFKIIGEITKTGATETFAGAAIAVGCKDIADASATAYSLVHLPDFATFGSYTSAATGRLNVPLAYNNSLNRTLAAGDTLTIEWTITIN